MNTFTLPVSNLKGFSPKESLLLFKDVIQEVSDKAALGKCVLAKKNILLFLLENTHLIPKKINRNGSYISAPGAVVRKRNHLGTGYRAILKTISEGWHLTTVYETDNFAPKVDTILIIQ